VLLDIATGMAGYLHQKHVCISRAFDTVELLRHAFVKNLEIKNIAVGNNELIGECARARSRIKLFDY